MKFDLVSDLHIDFWEDKYHYDWLHSQQSDTLVVAGDVSDHQDQTINYLISLKQYYKTIMFVDGNHEHQPNFLTIGLPESIRQWQGLAGIIDGIHFLGESPLTIGNTRFIGRNGWWCFNFGEPHIPRQQCLDAFYSKTKWTERVQKYQEHYGRVDCDELADEMLAAQWDSRIENVVVITHSLPSKLCISWSVYPENADFTGLYGNINYQKVFANDINKKLRRWCFGHNHDAKSLSHDYYTMTSNPRGRPADYNRISYTAKTITV